ncbi:hypothetical protein CBR_g52401 [Chara braunii]|uniref:Uncharacterized protein n=1 Tax=Chara braunii TaxID=69332 RepID=A0A388MA56_CHABU|nr:hypothetical protein CBR_g52401 [Chara braunii]|eukprot:GBG91446.1 hypothetical protein CBR_g52401 [Chara braunii]
MMKLAFAGTHGLAEEVRTIEEGPTQVEQHEQLMGGMYLLMNTLLQGDFDRKSSLSPMEGEDLVPKSQDDEFEEGEIKEAFRPEEYDGIYLELGLLLPYEMRNRNASDKVQRMRHLYHPDMEVPIVVGPSSESPHVKPQRGAQAPAREVRGVRVKKVPEGTAKAKFARIQARLAEIHEQRDKMEAAGIAPTPPADPKTGEQRIDELWARYESRREAVRQRSQEAGQVDERADEAIEIGELGFFAARRVIERVDRRIRQATTTSFQRYTLLSDELAIRKGEVE